MAAGIALALIAWPLFALAMPKHQSGLLTRELPRASALWLRIGGWGALIASLAIFMIAKGAGQGPIFWGASLVLTAIAWVLLLTFVPWAALAGTTAAAFALLVFA